MRDAATLQDYFWENTNQFYWLHDLTGKILQCSSSVYRLTGYPPEELIGRNPYDFFHPDDCNYIQQAGHEPSLAGQQIRIEYRFRKADGTYLWLETKSFPVKDAQGTLEGIYTISAPITEYRQFKSEIQKKDLLFEEAGKMARIGAWEYEVLTKSITWSKVTYAIYEVAEDFYPTLDVALTFFPEEEKQILVSHFTKALEQGIAYDCQVRFITAKGRKTWVRAIGKPEISYGKITKIYGVFQDIHQEVENKRLLQEVVAQLTTQKQQLLDFNQIVSHNLRAPVGNLGTLLTIYEAEKDPAEKAVILENVFKVSDSLQTILDELVDVVKITANTELEYEELNVRDVIEKVTILLRGDIRKQNAGIKIELDWETVCYPRPYLESIFLNLLSNALKYSSPERSLEMLIKSEHRDGKKILWFSDNGSGIDMVRNQAKIFKLHSTFHAEIKGKGLGLFMTKNQIESTGGSIAVWSELNKGTTFTITFRELPVKG